MEYLTRAFERLKNLTTRSISILIHFCTNFNCIFLFFLVLIIYIKIKWIYVWVIRFFSIFSVNEIFMFIICKFNEHRKVYGAFIILWIDLIVGDCLSRATSESVGWLSPFPLYPSSCGIHPSLFWGGWDTIRLLIARLSTRSLRTGTPILVIVHFTGNESVDGFKLFWKKFLVQ